MGILDVSIDTHQVDDWFVYAGYKARDAREPLRESIQNVVVHAAREQILSEGSRSGQPYEALNEEYELEKIEAVGFAHPILVRTGKMLRDLDDRTAVRVHMHSAHWNPYNDYLHWHQTGGYVEGRPPQRVVVALTTEDYEDIQDIFENWLTDLRHTNRRRTGPAELPSFSVQDYFDIL